MKVKKSKNKQILAGIAASAAILLLAYIIITAVSIWNYGNTDEKQRADAAIVLGAGTANGEVSPVYKERINHGIGLYENGYVDFLILTGGIGDGNDLSDAFAAKQYAIENGVPEEAILIEECSSITEENLEYAKELMDENSLENAIIVSDPLHMKRAILMAQDYGIEAYSSPTPTSRYQTLKTQIPFLAREEFFFIGYRLVRLIRK